MKPAPLIVAVAIFTAGCGSASASAGLPAASVSSSSSTGGSQTAGSTTDRRAAYKAVCALFTREEAQAVVGDTLQLAAAPAPFEDLTAGAVPGIGDATTYEYVRDLPSPWSWVNLQIAIA